MRKHSTIFQEEVHAIEYHARDNLLCNLKHKKMYIMSDSQSALKTLIAQELNQELFESV